MTDDTWTCRKTPSSAVLSRCLTVFVASAIVAACAEVTELDDVPSVGVTSAALTASALTARKPAAKPNRANVGKNDKHDEIVVKLAEGSRIRFANGQLEFDASRVSAKHGELLKRAGLNASSVASELNALRSLLKSEPSASIKKHIDVADAVLDRAHDEGEAAGGDELADLNLYYTVNVAPERQAALIDALNASPLVEIAYPAPVPVTAAMDIAPTTSSYESSQVYLDAAPDGSDVRYLWAQPGGTGTNRRVLDIEQAWNFAHEDLPTPATQTGTQSTAQASIDHGTAVAGIVVGAKNSYGVSGLAYGGTIGTVAVNGTITVANAIALSFSLLPRGEVILIEQQFYGPSSGTTCNSSCTRCPPDPLSQFEMVPVEYFQAEYDAIRTVTQNGYVVIEAAGNGSMNLNAATYNDASGNNLFNTRDSGAIMVGAGVPYSRQPACWSNSGTRVNVQNWGSGIYTTGYGDIQVNGTDQNQWYSYQFGGTSGASAITAGAAAAVQGAIGAAGGTLLSSLSMRLLLSASATPQPTPVTRQVGGQVDLRCAMSNTQPPSYGKVAAARQSTNVTTVLNKGCGSPFYQRSFTGSAWQNAAQITSSSNLAPRGAHIALAPWGSNRLAAFFVANDGSVRYFYEENDGAWQGSFALTAANFAPPGARVGTGMQGTSRLDVFVIANTGALNVMTVVGTGTWSGPTAISTTNYAAPGAAIATGVQTGNQLDVFTVRTNGALTAIWIQGTAATGWQGPTAISAANIYPSGAPIATNTHGSQQMDVFGVGNDGRLKAYYVNWSIIPFWDGPVNLSNAIATGGTEVSTITWPSNQSNVFFMSSTGALQWLRWPGTGNWVGPTALTSTGAAYPNASIAAATEGSKLDLFLVAHRGLSKASATSGSGPWSAFSPMQ